MRHQPYHSLVALNLSLFVATLLTSLGGSVTLVQPPDGSVVASANFAFIAEVDDADGLQSATRYVGDIRRIVWSGSANVDDAEIRADSPNGNYGTLAAVNVDAAAPHAHGLIRFNDLIGPVAVPANATVLSATLQLNCFDPGNLMTAYRLLEDWNESEVTWNSRAFGVGWTTAGAEGSSLDPSTGVPADCTAVGLRSIDLTRMVQDWADGLPNHGLVFVDGGTDGVDFSSSETADSPVLVVEFVVLTPAGVVDLLATASSASVDFGSASGLVNGQTYAWTCRLVDALNEESWAPAPATFLFDAGYPEIPALVAPEHNATGVPTTATLSVGVNDPDGEEMAVTFYGRRAVWGDDPFTIIVLPDSQKYVLNSGLEGIWYAQTQWIVDNVDALNIVFVTHEGDIVDTVSSSGQWDEAVWGMRSLDLAGVPYGIAPGNHDLSGTEYEDASWFNAYFPALKYAGRPWYGGHYPSEGNQNSYQLFSAGGMDFIALHLKFWPKSDAINWANGVLQSHPDRRAMITTHGYLDANAQRTVHVIGSTEYLWTDLIAPNPNVFLVFCGHVHAEAGRTDPAPSSVPGEERLVHQILADYQSLADGGQGYLRLLRFVPAEDRVFVQTYSPWLDAYQTDANSQFELDFRMSGFQVLGVVAGISSGGTASILWPDLELGQTHQWAALATDTTGRQSLSPTWTFSTTSNDTTPPVISGVAAVGLTETSATLTWTTDEPATSWVALDGGDPVGDSVYVTDHAVTLDGLTPATQYAYEVISADNVGNSASSPADTFATLAPNVPPVAGPQDLSTDEDTPLGITLTATDTDPLTYSVAAGPSAGSLSGAAPDLVYTPGLDYAGPDSFTFTVDDGRGGTGSALVSITIHAVQDAPSAPADLTAIAGDQTIWLEWEASTDPDSTALTYEIHRRTESGTYDPSPLSVTDQTSFSDDTVQNGTVYCYVVVCSDGTASSDPSHEVSARPDKFDPNAYVVRNPTLASGTLVSGDYSSLRLVGDGGQTLRESQAGVFGRLEGQYTLQTPVDIATISGNVTLFVDAVITSNPADGPWQLFAWSGSAWDGVGNLTQSESSLTANLAPENYVALDGTIRIAITDGGDLRKEDLDSLDLDRLYVVVPTGEPNTPPVANPGLLSTAEDTEATVTLTGSDPDNDPLTYRITELPAHGSAALGVDGATVAYAPDPDYNGLDSFAFVANDGLQESDRSLVDIIVTAVNDSPLAQDQSLTTDLNTPIEITLAADVDGDALTYDIASAPDKGSLSEISANQATYTPTGTGEDSFTFTVNDGQGGTASATVTITVTDPSATPRIHVGAIAMSLSSAGKNWKGTASVTVFDQGDDPVSGATVTGTWTFEGVTLGSGLGITDGAGVAVLTSSPVKASSGTFTFDLTALSLAGAEYAPSANAVTSGSIGIP